jgi:myo-inositol 2-dehydrogenase / D-chiro-inositol 1-dehydrogenase
MRAGVVGTSWGRVLVRALRAAGVEVVALAGLDAGRTRAVADELGIPGAHSDLAELHDLALDLVAVATPPDTHPEVLHALAGIPAVCEKPLLGLRGDAALLPDDGVWVNYAFPFLDAARTVAAALPEVGPVAAVEVLSRPDMPLDLTPAEWLLEVCCHPLSLVVHLLGEPALVDGRIDAPDAEMTLRLPGDVPCRVTCRPTRGVDGLEHHVALATASGVVELSGAWRTGGVWRFPAPTLDGDPLPAVAPPPDDVPVDEPCPWQRANLRSVAVAAAAATGRISAEGALRLGGFDLARARPLDEAVRRAFAR